MKKTKEKNQSVSTAQIAIWYVVSNFFVKGIAMLTTPVFSRLMLKSEYGQFNNFTSWESIITIIVTLDFSASIMRAKYDYKDEMKQYMSSIVLFGNIVTCIMYIIIELNSSFFVAFFSMEMRYIRMLFAYLLFMPAFSYLQIEHRIYGRYKFFVAYSVGTSLLRTGISVLLVLILENKLLGRLYGYIVPMIALNMCLWIYIVWRGRCLSLKYIKYACMISIPLIPHALAGSVLASSDRIMITRYCGDEATALYSLAYAVAGMAGLIWTAMNQAWSPWLFDRLNEGKLQEISDNSKVYLGIFTILIIGVFLGAPEIILIMGGAQYYDARYVMPPVILGCVFQFIYGMYVNIEIFMKKTFTISVGTVGAAVLNIILNLIFIPQFGYIAAAYTTLVGYIALFVFHYYIVKSSMKRYIKAYDKRFVMTIIALLSGLSIITLGLYNQLLIRYILIILYIFALLIGVYKYRGKIRTLIYK